MWTVRICCPVALWAGYCQPRLLWVSALALQVLKLFCVFSTVGLTRSVRDLTVHSITPPLLCYRNMP